MSRPIRVALLTTSVEFGGIERVLLNLMRHMDRAVEFFPIVFTRTDTREKSFFDDLDASGVPYQTIYVNAFKPKYFNAARNVGEAIAVLRRQPFDLIHSHGYRADVIGLALSRYLDIPLVSTCHGFIRNDRRLRFYNDLNVFLLRYFTAVIAVSARMKQDLVARGVAAAKIRVITNAVADVTDGESEKKRRSIRERMGIRDTDMVFGFVGRLSEEKGLDYLVRAARDLSVENDAIRLLVVGDGPRRTMLEQTVREFGIATKVDFVGFQSDPSAWYPAMDAFVLPSLTEGTPMALLEAMAHGRPVIGTSVGGVPAILSHNENGLLVPPADLGKLVEAMRTVSADSGLRQRLSCGALRSVREAYDVRAWTRKVHEVYMTTIQGTRRS